MPDTRNIVSRLHYEALVAEVAAGTKSDSDLDSVYVVLFDPPSDVRNPDGSLPSSVITGGAVAGKLARGYRLQEPVQTPHEPVPLTMEPSVEAWLPRSKPRAAKPK